MYKIYKSKSKTVYLYDSVSDNFFEMDKKSRKLIQNMEGNTNELRVLGDDE